MQGYITRLVVLNVIARLSIADTITKPTKNHVTENDHRVEVQVTNTQLWVPVPQG